MRWLKIIMPDAARAAVSGIGLVAIAALSSSSSTAMAADQSAILPTTTITVKETKSDKLILLNAKEATVPTQDKTNNAITKIETVFGIPYTQSQTRPPSSASRSSEAGTAPSTAPNASDRQSFSHLPPHEEVAPGEIEWSTGSAATAKRYNENIDLAVPLRDGRFFLGDVTAHIYPKGEVGVRKERLIQLLEPLLRLDILEKIKNLPEKDGFLSLDALRKEGFGLQYALCEGGNAGCSHNRATGYLAS